MTLVIVGASTEQRMQDAISAFEMAGFRRISELDGVSEGDLVLGISDGGAEVLREADRRAIKYVLIHDGEDDRHDGGTYERAHHRIEACKAAGRDRGRRRRLRHPRRIEWRGRECARRCIGLGGRAALKPASPPARPQSRIYTMRSFTCSEVPWLRPPMPRLAEPIR